jgi:tripartite-type tricarboxylate transporter receptor subunit TctC
MMKSIFAYTLTIACALVPSMAAASSYPEKPIKIVVPFGAGSATDILTRGVADGLSKRLGQAVVVENRAGAGGAIGATAVANASPDGYTLVMGTNGPFAANVSLYSQLPYDPLKDFEPVMLMGRLPMMLVANSTAKATTVQELIAEAKANPDKVNFGASNTTARVWVELLKKSAGIQAETVLYSNVGGMLSDLMGGQIPYAFENVGPSRPLVESGKLKALAVTSAERANFAPQVPTMAESGLDKHELVVWFALFAPKGTPADIVERLNKEANEVLKTPEIIRIADQISMKPAGGPPSDLAAYHKREVDNWRSLVQYTGVEIN